MFWPTKRQNKGFFIAKEEQISPTKKTKLKNYTCEECGLYLNCNSPKMQPTGEGRKEVLIISEAPEDVGETQLLKDKLNNLGVGLDRDFWKTYSIICCPPNNREPKQAELKCCRSNIQKAIDLYKPKMIWLLGNSALESYFLDYGIDNLKINLWRKRCIPDYKNNCWVVPLLHPSFMLHNEENELIESVYNRDLKWAVNQIGKELPKQREEKLHILLNFNNIKNKLIELINMKKETLFVFDYETTGIKPHKNGHKIACQSFCMDGINSYCFPYQYPGCLSKTEEEEIKQLWIKVLQNKYLLKVAQGLKFEDSWSRKFFTTINPDNWHCCTMTTQHILDCRSGASGLKFQAFVRWGIIPYEKEIKPFLEKADENGFNKVMEAPLNKLLEYCAKDSLYEHWLYEDQQEELNLKSNTSLKKAAEFFHEGILTFADMEHDGINTDVKFYAEEKKKLTKRIDKLNEQLNDSEEAKLFFEKEGKKLNWGSNTDLPKLLFKYLGVQSIKQTAKGSNSVDAEAIISYVEKVPILAKLILKRKLLKIRDTYIAQFEREVADDNRIYPIMNLHLTRSMRSSCDSPNMQNQPRKDEDAKRSTRMGIIPSEGNKIGEVDFSGIEVHLAACYTKDPILVNYLWDKNTDMHRDQACLLFKLDKEQVSSEIRFCSKNGWVFPQFYTSYYKSCARNIWKEIPKLKLVDGTSLLKYLEKNKLGNYNAFEFHCKKVETLFWNKFKVFKEWQNKWIENYKKKGFTESFFGHRREELLDTGQIVNTSIQGAAFHCLLWCLIKINKIRKEEQWKTKMPAQIHDSIIFDMLPSEEEHILEVVKKVTTKDLVEAHPWINVPMEVEIEMAPIGKSWYEKVKIV
jgi:DNA polymerase